MSAALDRIGARAVLTVAWPILISMLSRSLLVSVDTIFVSHLGTTSLAALGQAVGASFVPLALGMGVAASVGVVTAQRTGGGRESDRFGREALGLMLLLGFVGWALAPLGPHLFPLLGTSVAATPLASAFFAWRMFGAPAELAVAGLNGWFNGRGDTRTPMVATLITNGLNVALDAVFVLVLGLGVPGAAIATELSIGVGLVFLLTRARFLPRLPSRATARQVLDIGGPMGLHDALDVLAFVLFGALLAHVGEEQMAAHIVVLRILSFSFMPGHAIGQATSVLVGQALGARRARQASEALRAGVGLAVGLMAVVGVVMAAVPGPMLAVFSVEPEVEVIARRLLWVGATFQVFDAIVMVVFGALRGAGDTRFVFRAGIVPSWLVKLPVGAIGALWLGWGAVGGWLGLTAEMAVVTGFALWRVRNSAWIRRGGRTAAAA